MYNRRRRDSCLEMASCVLLYIEKIGHCHQRLVSGLGAMEKMRLGGVRSQYLETMSFKAGFTDAL